MARTCSRAGGGDGWPRRGERRPARCSGSTSPQDGTSGCPAPSRSPRTSRTPVPHRAALTPSSTKGPGSSTTRTRSTPLSRAKRRTASRSRGQRTDNCRVGARVPSSSRAWATSTKLLPVATMPRGPPASGQWMRLSSLRAHVGLGQGRLALHQLALHGQRPESHDDGVEALGVAGVRQARVEAGGAAADRARAVADRGDELEGGDHAEPAAQGDGVGAEAQDVLHVGGVEGGHPARAQGPVAGPWGDRALGAVVLAAQQDHGAAARGAGEVGEPGLVRDPHGAVGLPVPEGVDVAGGRVLAAEHGRGRGLLVDAELMDGAAQLVEPVELLDHGQVEAAEGRALVAADPGPVDRAARFAVVSLLVQEQPDDRLDTGEEDGAVPFLELVGERRRQLSNPGYVAVFTRVEWPGT